MENQDLKNKLTTLLTSFNTLEEVEYLEERLRTTDKINRQTKQGRELTEELLNLCNERAIVLQKTNVPFN